MRENRDYFIFAWGGGYAARACVGDTEVFGQCEEDVRTKIIRVLGGQQGKEVTAGGKRNGTNGWM